ncbi:laminin subunit beta-3 [Latimeria chalumnae]|uniref:laminin subunit beta-3 n=1 Tax=Latimeria chalumnae TaxID=7897 RepID=UPI0003C18229|nr:PREDICTED: laminin subunit beta-3 [Latimeria chalumnae]|eukprot:XP_005987722.1 PREDICTED: laminin subunit beta-3 [Latimeria chalumnae]
MLTLLLLLGLSSFVLAQQDCSRGACYPPTGDLLIGRANQLKASSTCGLTKPESFCTPHGQWQLRCCRCDSRRSYTRTSHRIENVLSSAGPLRWWQSAKDVDEVSLQLDLDRPLQLSDLVLDFRGPRPAGMVIERSMDFGKTWKVYQYLSDDCAVTFPLVKQGSPQNLEDVRCQEMQPSTRLPATEKVQFRPLEMTSRVAMPQSQKINYLAGFTNLRVNFTKLARPSRVGYRSPDAFYALSEMRVQGSCFCFGHADRCTAGNTYPAYQGNQVEVFETCVCQHNTVGPNCERCADFYSDQPWRPADDRNPNECKRCNCNNHSQRCHFDQGLFESTGGVSGGVCDDCRDNTMGRNCESCKPHYFRNPLQDITHRDACISCECDPDGSIDGGMCDPVTGRCRCKENVEGERCDRCKAGFSQLAASNPQGCRRCVCNPLGSRSGGTCEEETGHCVCLPNVIGQACDQCAANYWNMISGQGCQPCGCDPANSYSLQCNQFTGQCLCKPGFGGLKCTACPDKTYGNLRTGCLSCDCNFLGTEGAGCDKVTGQCLCKAGMMGRRCDQCGRGYCNEYSNCVQCHPCFQSFDNEIGNIVIRQGSLYNMSAHLEGTRDQDLGPRISRIEKQLTEIQRSVTKPLLTEMEMAVVKNNLQRIKKDFQDIYFGLPLVDRTQYLRQQLSDLEHDLRNLEFQYQNKKKQFDNILNVNPSGAFNTINSAYEISADADNRVSAASGMTDKSSKTRKNVETLMDEIKTDLTKLEDLKNELYSPNLTPTANQICGDFRSDPCTPEHCDGALCEGVKNVTCDTMTYCRGTMPLARNAIDTAKKTSSELQSLNTQLQESARKIRETENVADRVKDDAQRLADQVSSTRAQMNQDLQQIRGFIQNVRDFLMAPDTDPSSIQKVSDYVLSLQLPSGSGKISNMLQEIQDVVKKLPNVKEVLAQTQQDVERAKELQQQAEDARDKANAVEGNVDKVAENLQEANAALQEAGKVTKNSQFALQEIQNQISQIQDVLSNSEDGLEYVASRLGTLNNGITQLHHKTDQNQEEAKKAQQLAFYTEDTAAKAEQDFALVNKKYKELQKQVGKLAPPDTTERVRKLQQEAEGLMKKSTDMIDKIDGIETELEEGYQMLRDRSASLEDLEKKVRKIKESIWKKVEYYSTCK